VRELGPWYVFAACVLKPLALAFTRQQWRGFEHVPREGGFVLAANHISHADPVVLADFVVFGVGRPGRFLAKSTLFRGRGLVATVMRGAKQIPVHRQTSEASSALRDAVAALAAGECIVIYPEGTVSRDAGKWPMRARTGVARLALLSGAPVVPVAQWGAQEIHDTYRTRGLHLLPPHRVTVVAGPPVDLSAYAGRELTAEVLRDATADVMAAITGLLEPVRGERRPARVHEHVVAPSRESRTA
jgi:1-acyl-sn-glycerol-3-phosphate acyltransferase